MALFPSAFARGLDAELPAHVHRDIPFDDPALLAAMTAATATRAAA